MATEFFRGSPLTPEQLDEIREQIESGFDLIEVIDPELRGIVERNWPHLVSKLPPTSANDNPDPMSFEQTSTVIPPVPTNAMEALEACERIEGEGFANVAGPLRDAVEWANLKDFLAALAHRR